MTKFMDAMNRATAFLYKVVWLPEDWPLKRLELCTSYVVAKSMDEAAARLSSNKADIKSVTMISHIIERQTSTSLDIAPQIAP